MENIFGFAGRISRLIFLYFFLFGVVVNVIVRLWNPTTTFGLELIMGLVIIVGIIWITACAVVKRFHDLNQSGWNYWRLFIPLYNIYLLGLLLFQKGTAGTNTYGDDPFMNENALVEPEGKKNTSETRGESGLKTVWAHGETTVAKRVQGDVKYCKQCGTKHMVDAKFCASCGMRI